MVPVAKKDHSKGLFGLFVAIFERRGRNLTEFGAVLYDIGSANDGRPGYAVTLEQHVEIASGARGAQDAGGTRGTGYAVMEIPISKNNRRPTALFDCL